MIATLDEYAGLVDEPLEQPVTDAEYGRAWLAHHPVCPACDGDLVETTHAARLTVARRYVCPDCWSRWRPDAAGSLRNEAPRA